MAILLVQGSFIIELVILCSELLQKESCLKTGVLSEISVKPRVQSTSPSGFPPFISGGLDRAGQPVKERFGTKEYILAAEIITGTQLSGWQD